MNSEFEQAVVKRKKWWDKLRAIEHQLADNDSLDLLKERDKAVANYRKWNREVFELSKKDHGG